MEHVVKSERGNTVQARFRCVGRRDEILFHEQVSFEELYLNLRDRFDGASGADQVNWLMSQVDLRLKRSMAALRTRQQKPDVAMDLPDALLDLAREPMDDLVIGTERAKLLGQVAAWTAVLAAWGTAVMDCRARGAASARACLEKTLSLMELHRSAIRKEQSDRVIWHLERDPALREIHRNRQSYRYNHQYEGDQLYVQVLHKV